MPTRLPFAALLFAAALSNDPAAVQRGAAGASSPTVVYVTVLDGKKVPVTDLSAADFSITEDGQRRSIVSAEIATAPLQIAIVVDDNGTGLFRYGVATLAERLQGRAELAIFVVTGQLRKVLDFTTDARAWSAAIASIGVGPATNEGGQLLEGVSETARELKRREARRPAIIVLTVGGEEHSTLQARHVLDQLHDCGASLFVVSAANSALRPTRAAAKPAELLDSNLQLQQVLGDGPKQSGGQRRDVIAATGLLTSLQDLARDLTAQYAVTYLRQDGGRRSQRITVGVARPGIRIIAPTRAPAR